MSAKVCQSLKEMLGERATDELFERQFYERDLAPVPDFLVSSMAKTMPDIVVRPNSIEEVAAIVKMAAQERIPVTGRAGGSTVYFNTVCTKNGILLDMNELKGVHSVDGGNNTVKVAAGTVWRDLERDLNRRELSVCSYPSSAPAATVGGWLAMMGYGIGSLKFGPLINQVIGARTVLPDGSIQNLTTASKVPVSWMAGSEGTLGIMTEIELRVRPLPEQEWHGLAECRTAADTQRFIEQAVQLSNLPFNLHFSDPACNALRYRHGMASKEASQSYTVAFDADGTKAATEAARKGYFECLAATGAADKSEEAAEEWENRFFSLLLKREAPSLLGAELLLPVSKLAAYLQSIADFDNSHHLGLKTYGHVVTSSHVMIMTMFNADERDTVGYLQGLALVKKLHDIGAGYGASPYGIGLWNTPYLSRSYNKAQLTELRRRKQQLDPCNIMNPGKLYQSPLFLTPPLYSIGMDVLAATRLFYKGRSQA